MSLFNSTGGVVNRSIAVNTYTTGAQSSPAIVTLSTREYLVLWVSDSHPLDSSGQAVLGRMFTSTGVVLCAEFLVTFTSVGNQFGPAVGSVPGGRAAAAWISDAQDGSGLGVYTRVWTLPCPPPAVYQIMPDNGPFEGNGLVYLQCEKMLMFTGHYCGFSDWSSFVC